MNPMLFIAIEFSDGSKVKYSFPVQAPNSAARQMKIEDFLKGRKNVNRVVASETEIKKDKLPSETETVVLQHAL